MKQAFTPLIFLVLGFALLGCGNDSAGKVDVPNPDRVERKDFKDMTKEEKIEFINKTPMSEEAKAKEIERINRGEI